MNLLRILLFVGYVVGILLLIAFGGNEHDWMTQMDPSLEKGAFESSGNRQIFTATVLVTLLATQVFAIVRAKSRHQKIASGLLILIACMVWFIFSFNA